MKWKLYNLTRLWVLSAGLLGFFWPRLSSAEGFNTWLDRYLTNSVSVSSLEWYLYACPPLGDEHNFEYATVAINPADNGSVLFASPVVNTRIHEPRWRWNSVDTDEFKSYISILRNSPSIAGVSCPRLPPGSTDCDGTLSDPSCEDPLPDTILDLYISPDPILGRGVCVPIYSASVAAMCHYRPSASNWRTCDNQPYPVELHGRNLYLSRAYVLPQRIKVVSESGYDASQLWDMYGDGRLFLPRFVYDGGYLESFNCTPFDEDLWAQLQFYPSSDEQFRSSVFYSEISPVYSRFGFTRSSYFKRFNGRVSSAGNLLYRIQNLKHFTVSTNLVDPSLFPPFEDLLVNHLRYPLNSPSSTSWQLWHYIPQSIQFADFGNVKPNANYTTTPSKLQGCVGVLIRPISSSSGAYASFRHFYLVPSFQPKPNAANTSTIANIIFYKPSGIAWDVNGGLVFDYVKSGLGLPDLLKWPYTSSWDYDSSFSIYNTGSSGPITPGPPNVYPGPQSLPIPVDPAVAGVPPVPAPRATGGSQPHFPIPFLGGPQGVGSGNGTSLLGQGQDAWRLNGNLSTVSHSTLPTSMPINDVGDLVGDYSLTYPGMSDLYDLDAYATVIEQQYTHQLVDYASMFADESGGDNYPLVGDFAQRGAHTGQFGVSVQQSHLGDSPVDPRLFGRFDTSKSWFYTYLPAFEPILPKTQYLVLPVVRQDWETGGITLQDEPFEVPEIYANFRPLLLILVSVGLSAWFIMLVMKLFQGGN